MAINLQTAFLSPPMAMSAYYLKGVSPPHVQMVLVKVPRIDLSVAILIGLGLAGYDLWTQLGPGRRL